MSKSAAGYGNPAQTGRDFPRPEKIFLLFPLPVKVTRRGDNQERQGGATTRSDKRHPEAENWSDGMVEVWKNLRDGRAKGRKMGRMEERRKDCCVSCTPHAHVVRLVGQSEPGAGRNVRPRGFPKVFGQRCKIERKSYNGMGVPLTL